MRVVTLFIVIALAVATNASAQSGVAAGAQHTCAVDTTGAVTCWGDNSGGQLGDGVIGAAIKLDVPLPPGIATIAAGTSHACATTGGGAAYCWGNNDAGELGDGTITSRPTPATVNGSLSVRAIEAGQGFTCALTAAGGVKCWGFNTSGQLGDGTTTKRPAPVDVSGLTGGVRAIAAGDSHACALTTSGGVKCWGSNNRGQIGDGTNAAIRTTPADVQGLGSGIVAIGAGETHTCAIDSTGGVKCWGSNDGGQVGDGSTTQRNAPATVVGIGGSAQKVVLNYRKTCALLAGGLVRCWGNGSDPTQPIAPADVSGLTSGVTDIAAGQFHLCALTATKMKCWGPSLRGELGNGAVDGSQTPVDVIDVPSGIKAMALGSLFTCALMPTNSVKCWGDNFYGELGSPNPKDYNVASKVANLTNAKTISAGRDHSCALVGNGAKCWGTNTRGQLGDGTTQSKGTPVDVAGLTSGVKAVYAGNYQSCAVTTAGGLKCWGSGQPTAMDISGLTSGVADVTLGGSHTCVLTTGGGVKCFGNNNVGQLGNGTTLIVPNVVDVTGLTSGVASITAGTLHTCALTAAGAVKCWGGNTFGQIGDGTTTNRASPVDVATAIGPFKSVDATNLDTCAVTRAGAVWCWGNVSQTFFGATSSTPTLVPSFASGVRTIQGGDGHLCALMTDGTISCAGANGGYQLGDGSKMPSRRKAQQVVAGDGGVHQLDTTPGGPTAYTVVATGTGINVNATLRFKSQDVGQRASTYVFALVPRSLVSAAAASTDKDSSPCVLAQVTPTGDLTPVTSVSGLQAYSTGVLTSAGQAVTVMNGVSTSALAGSTFYVGYGTSASAMVSNGTNTSVAAVGTPVCDPQSPQTGWWWNPAEGGRGYSIEVQGNHLFFASFLYDASGRSTWYVSSGNTSLDGSSYQGDLLGAAGGQTLGGAYPGFPRVTNAGTLSLSFTDASHGTMVWPGGTVPIERFNIVPNGLTAPPQANQPENGWWWNPNESGRGFFIEWQNGSADLAGYMYDDSGNPVWYISVYATPSARTFSGSWWLYANGQTLTGPYKPATRVNDNFAPVTVQFSGPDTAIMTLPGGRTTTLTRYRF